MSKSPDAFRTISEVAEWLETPTHVLRFWEGKFPQVKPTKRAGGRRYYRPADMALLGGIKTLLRDEGLTIKGVQKILRDKGVKHVASLSQPVDGEDEGAPVDMAPVEPPVTSETAAPDDAPLLEETAQTPAEVAEPVAEEAPSDPGLDGDILPPEEAAQADTTAIEDAEIVEDTPAPDPSEPPSFLRMGMGAAPAAKPADPPAPAEPEDGGLPGLFSNLPRLSDPRDSVGTRRAASDTAAEQPSLDLDLPEPYDAVTEPAETPDDSALLATPPALGTDLPDRDPDPAEVPAAAPLRPIILALPPLRQDQASDLAPAVATLAALAERLSQPLSDRIS